MAARNAFIALIGLAIVLPLACAQNAPSKQDATPAAASSEEAEEPPPATNVCPEALRLCQTAVNASARAYAQAKVTQNICEAKVDAGVADHPHASDVAKVGFFGQGQGTCKHELVECEKIRSTVVKDMADALDMMGKACGYGTNQ